MSILDMVGRNKELSESDLVNTENCIQGKVLDSKFLVIGGAGSIGQGVTKEVFKVDPQAPHIVNISENNMVELVRDLPSIEGYGSGDFKTFSVGSGSVEFKALMASQGSYDCVFNLNHSLLGGCN